MTYSLANYRDGFCYHIICGDKVYWKRIKASILLPCFLMVSIVFFDNRNKTICINKYVLSEYID